MIIDNSTKTIECENSSSQSGFSSIQIPNMPRGGGIYVNVVTVLVEPNVLFRAGLASILGAANFGIVHSAGAIGSSVLSILSQYPSILLVIGASDGAEAVARQIELFKATQRSGRVAVLADKCHLNDVLLMFRAGANAYLTNLKSCDALIKSLELVMLGETLMPSEVLSFIPDHQVKAIECDVQVLTQVESHAKQVDCEVFVSRLSAQETRILQCLTEGKCNKAIARKMDIAEATVKVHLKSIFRKIPVHNRTQAVVWAMKEVARQI